MFDPPLFGGSMHLTLLLTTHRFHIILWISRSDVNNGFFICEGERNLAFPVDTNIECPIFSDVWKYQV